MTDELHVDTPEGPVKLNPDFEKSKLELLIKRQERKEKLANIEAIRVENERICGLSPVGHVYKVNTGFTSWTCVGCGLYTYAKPVEVEL